MTMNKPMNTLVTDNENVITAKTLLMMLPFLFLSFVFFTFELVNCESRARETLYNEIQLETKIDKVHSVHIHEWKRMRLCMRMKTVARGSGNSISSSSLGIRQKTNDIRNTRTTVDNITKMLFTASQQHLMQ